MADIVSLANIALRRVGVTPVVSLTEGTPQSGAVRDLIPVVRDAMQTEHTWRFAKKQIELAENATAPLYGYKKAFVLPPDVLLVTHMKNDGKYSVMNIENKKVLVTDSETAVITYRARVEEDGLWDPYFRDAFAYRLAAELALALNENLDLSKRMLELHTEIIDAAMAADSIESTEVRTISPTTLIDARSSSGTWGSDVDHPIKIG